MMMMRAQYSSDCGLWPHNSRLSRLKMTLYLGFSELEKYTGASIEGKGHCKGPSQGEKE